MRYNAGADRQGGTLCTNYFALMDNVSTWWDATLPRRGLMLVISTIAVSTNDNTSLAT